MLKRSRPGHLFMYTIPLPGRLMRVGQQFGCTIGHLQHMTFRMSWERTSRQPRICSRFGKQAEQGHVASTALTDLWTNWQHISFFGCLDGVRGVAWCSLAKKATTRL